MKNIHLMKSREDIIIMKMLKYPILLAFLILPMIIQAQTWQYEVRFDETTGTFPFPTSDVILQMDAGMSGPFQYDFLTNTGAGPNGSFIYMSGPDGTPDMEVTVTVVTDDTGEWEQIDGDWDDTSSGSFRSDYQINNVTGGCNSKVGSSAYVKFDFTFINGLESSVSADYFSTRHSSTNGGSEGYEWTQIFINGVPGGLEANIPNYTNIHYSDVSGSSNFDAAGNWLNAPIQNVTGDPIGGTEFPNNMTISEFLGGMAGSGFNATGWYSMDGFNSNIFDAPEHSGGMNPMMGDNPDGVSAGDIGGSAGSSSNLGGITGNFGFNDGDLITSVTYLFGLHDVSFDTDGDGCTQLNTLPAAGVTEFNLGFSTCILTASGIASITCNQGADPVDPLDDFITFDVNPTVTSPGASNMFNITGLPTGATTSPIGPNFTYGTTVTVTLPAGSAGGGDILSTYAIADVDNLLDCTLSFDIIDPGSCAECGIQNVMTSTTCNTDGTYSLEVCFDHFNPLSAPAMVNIDVNGTMFSNQSTTAGANCITLNDASFIGNSETGISVTIEDVSSSSSGPSVFISEFHYDNTGGDVNEFIEITGSAGTDLTGWSIVLYNGSNGTSYDTESLSSTLSDLGAGCGIEVVTVVMQNGGPDGFALVDDSGTVVEFLSYEGSFMATNGPASGMTSTDVGVSESSSAALGSSISWDGTTWTFNSGTNTMGTVNAGLSCSSVMAIICEAMTTFDEPSCCTIEATAIAQCLAGEDKDMYEVVVNVSAASGTDNMVDITVGGITMTGQAVGSDIVFGPFTHSGITVGGGGQAVTITDSDVAADCKISLFAPEVLCGYGNNTTYCSCEISGIDSPPNDGVIVAQSMPGSFDANNIQVYILVDASGVIQATNLTGIFTGLANGMYNVYSVNYPSSESTTINPFLVAGGNIDVFDMGFNMGMGPLGTACFALCGPAPFTVNCTPPTFTAVTLMECPDAAGSLTAEFTLTDAENPMAVSNMTMEEVDHNTDTGTAYGNSAAAFNATLLNITYHPTEAEALANTGAITGAYTSTDGTAYARIEIVEPAVPGATPPGDPLEACLDGCIYIIPITLNVKKLQVHLLQLQLHQV